MKRAIAAIGLAAALFGAVPAGVSAQEDPAKQRSTQFRAMHGPSRESVPGAPLLIAAYAIAWVLVLAYVARLGFLNARVSRDVARLEKQLRAKDAAAPSEPAAKQP
jgi:hypothetical protein